MIPNTNTRTYRIPVAIASLVAFAALASRAPADDTAPPPASPPATAPASASAPAPQAPVEVEKEVIEGVSQQTSILPTKPTESVGGIAQVAQDVPRSLTEITPAQFQNDVIQSYNDFEKYSPAVTANTGAVGNYGSPEIRGTNSDVYQDGIRTMARTSNEHPFDINAYESADVVAGPASVIFGPSARTAGYVNYQTKEPYTDQQHTTLNLNLGQFVEGGAGYHQADNFQVDNGGPINANLAYRVSVQEEDANSYYQYTYDRYQDLYAALTYHTKNGFTLDWNTDYGYFTYNNPGGYNRVTQSLLDSGQYLSGLATPVIQGTFTGSSSKIYYSPVYQPGVGFTGNSGTYITRTKTSSGGVTNYTAGAVLPGTPTSNGTVVGWVLDPNAVSAVHVNGYQGLTNNNNDPLITKEFATQLRASKDLSPDSSIQNNAYYEFFFNDTAVNGGTYNWINDNLFEDRLEYRHKDDFKLFGQDISHDSNTGLSFRFEQVLNYKDSDPAAVTAGGDQFDLTGNPSAITRNALFGTTVYPLPYADRNVTSPYFGPLLFSTPSIPNPNDAEFSVTPGGGYSGTSTTTNHTWTQEYGLYSEHSFVIGDHWIYNVGSRLTGVFSKLADPLVDPTDPTSVQAGTTVDHISALIPSAETSLEYKPVSRVTLYDTYDYVQARNGMTTGSPTWAGGGQNDLTAKAFHSVSQLFEEGVKTELIPGSLFWTADYYHQTRQQTVGTDLNGDPVLGLTLYRGFETSLRYQASRQFDIGANYTYISANDLNVAVTTEPIIANNATVLQPGTALAAGDYLIPEVPHQNLTVYGDYRFDSGFGVSPSLTAHSWEVYNYTSATTHNTIPGKYTANVTFFYNRPSWKVSLDVLNLTSQTDFAGNLPVAPLAVQGRLTLRL